MLRNALFSDPRAHHFHTVHLNQVDTDITFLSQCFQLNICNISTTLPTPCPHCTASTYTVPVTEHPRPCKSALPCTSASLSQPQTTSISPVLPLKHFWRNLWYSCCVNPFFLSSSCEGCWKCGNEMGADPYAPPEEVEGRFGPKNDGVWSGDVPADALRIDEQFQTMMQMLKPISASKFFYFVTQYVPPGCSRKSEDQTLIDTRQWKRLWILDRLKIVYIKRTTVVAVQQLCPLAVLTWESSVAICSKRRTLSLVKIDPFTFFKRIHNTWVWHRHYFRTAKLYSQKCASGHSNTNCQG